MKKSFGIGFIEFCLFVFIGWVSNIVQIVQNIYDPLTALFIAKCAGVFFFPLGSILGIIGWF